MPTPSSCAGRTLAGSVSPDLADMLRYLRRQRQRRQRQQTRNDRMCVATFINPDILRLARCRRRSARCCPGAAGVRREPPRTSRFLLLWHRRLGRIEQLSRGGFLRRTISIALSIGIRTRFVDL